MPYPDGRETPAERHYVKCRGPLGYHVLTGTGYQSTHKVTRELARALWRSGLDVSCEVMDSGEIGWTRTSIRHLEGMVKQPFAFLSWGRTGPMFQTRHFEGQARIEIDVVDAFKWADERDIGYINNRVDLLVVPGQSSKEAFVNAGVTIPVEIVPHGVDTTVYQPWPKDEKLLSEVVFPGRQRVDGTLFLTGGFLQPRKGLRECLQAFRLAFEGGMAASLIVLTNAFGHGQSVADLITENHDLPIGVIGGLDEWSMARLYSSVDWFVSLHKMEAFGMMPLEAMACGTPSIVTDYDGPTQYLSGMPGKDAGLVVSPKGYEMVPVPGHPSAECLQAIIDPDEAAGVMHWAAEYGHDRVPNPSYVQDWTWQRAADALTDATSKHISPIRGHREAWPIRSNSAESFAMSTTGNMPLGDMGLVTSRLMDGMAPCYVVHVGQKPLLLTQPGSGITVYSMPQEYGAWTDPLAELDLAGVPFAAVHLDGRLDWYEPCLGYYPAGLGLIDLVLWAKSQGVAVELVDCEIKEALLPPWWDGARGQAEAEERLKSHLDQLHFWWDDLIQHIHATGWWGT